MASRPVPLAAVVALRPRQWLKNVLVFAAPLAAGKVLEADVFWPTVGAFISFCLASSATYLINDLRDVKADQIHPTKRCRPIAAGELSPALALVMAIALLILGFGIAWLIRPELAAVIGAYLVFTVSYSLGLKHEPVIELAVLSMGFLLRAIAGGVASDLPISQWFLIVAGFGSLFMATGKRYCELSDLQTAPDPDARVQRKSLAGYSLSYLRFVWSLAAAVTITAYCLWAFEVGAEPSTVPWAQWSVLPFVLGILRYAVDIDQGKAEAPEAAVLKDQVLLLTGLVWVVLFGLGAMGI
ncbi:MAG: decaprenyl-phosphate phosphoribosyltransferase [Actinomycetota bacterium]|nr:decaprenyl-phosphate phosphoribosyltransferase [Actinomycetota bacterium]